MIFVSFDPTESLEVLEIIILRIQLKENEKNIGSNQDQYKYRHHLFCFQKALVTSSWLIIQSHYILLLYLFPAQFFSPGKVHGFAICCRQNPSKIIDLYCILDYDLKICSTLPSK